MMKPYGRRKSRSPFKPDYQYLIFYDEVSVLADGRDVRMLDSGMLLILKSSVGMTFRYSGKKKKLNRIVDKHGLVSLFKGRDADSELMVWPGFVRGREMMAHEDEYKAEAALDKKLLEVAGVDAGSGVGVMAQMMMMTAFYETMFERMVIHKTLEVGDAVQD